jgi:hypothetical protein
MDNKLKKYETAIMSIVSEYAKIKYANIVGGNQLIIDNKNHQYQVVTIGWDNNEFVHDCPMHFAIINNKIWIQQNMTEWEVGEMLEEQGVPKSDIVIGFLSPDLRPYSKYAIA